MDPPATVAPGLELLVVLLPERVEEGGILHCRTWWRVTEPVPENTLLAFHLSLSGSTPRRGTPSSWGSAPA